MTRWILNVALLSGKELRSVMKDVTLMALILFAFTVAKRISAISVSAFVRSQVAAIFATSLICLIPSVNFSGLLYPVSTLTGPSHIIGLTFPSSWFQIVSLGTFTKGLGMASFGQAYLALMALAFLFVGGARLMLGKQEK